MSENIWNLKEEQEKRKEKNKGKVVIEDLIDNSYTYYYKNNSKEIIDNEKLVKVYKPPLVLKLYAKFAYLINEFFNKWDNKGMNERECQAAYLDCLINPITEIKIHHAHIHIIILELYKAKEVKDEIKRDKKLEKERLKKEKEDKKIEAQRLKDEVFVAKLREKL